MTIGEAAALKYLYNILHSWLQIGVKQIQFKQLIYSKQCLGLY